MLPLAVLAPAPFTPPSTSPATPHTTDQTLFMRGGHKWSGVDTPLSSSRACPTAFIASPVPVYVLGCCHVRSIVLVPYLPGWSRWWPAGCGFRALSPASWSGFGPWLSNCVPCWLPSPERGGRVREVLRHPATQDAGTHPDPPLFPTFQGLLATGFPFFTKNAASAFVLCRLFNRFWCRSLLQCSSSALPTFEHSTPTAVLAGLLHIKPKPNHEVCSTQPDKGKRKNLQRSGIHCKARSGQEPNV